MRVDEDELIEIAKAEAKKEREKIDGQKRLGQKVVLSRILAVVRDRTTQTIFIDKSGHPYPNEHDLHPTIKAQLPYTSKMPWPTTNCAEIKACNRALFSRTGAQLEDLECATIIIKSGLSKKRCRNCQQSLQGASFHTDV